MAQKRKRDPVTPEMRKRLLANRDGRITPNQWLDLIIQPLIVVMVLFGVGFLVFGEYMLALFDDAWWLILPIIALLVFLPGILRAVRYARMPVHFARLEAGVQPWWGFWRPVVFYDAADHPVTFPRRLAPRPALRVSEPYIVYYLDEPQGKVLLSAAPAEHEDAESWLPTRNFDIRQERRFRRS